MRLFFIRKLPEDKGFIPSLCARAGFTLVEALFTILILAMIMVAMIPFIRTVHTTWNFGDRKTELQQNGRVGLEMMSRLLRQTKRITGIPASGSGNFIKFRDSTDTQTIIFFHNIPTSPYYVGNTGLIRDNDLVMRTIVNGTVNNALLAKSLSSFQINFKDNLGAVATKPFQVSSMDISLGLSDPQGLISDIINIFSSISLRSEVKIDKPVWLTSGNNIVGLLTDDWIAGFSSPNSVSVNNVLLVNGKETVWVADTGRNRIRRIYWTGSTWAYNNITGFSSPRSVSVNPNEIVNGKETVWVADTGRNRIRRIYWTGSTWAYNNITGFSSPRSVCVNPNERVNARNTCWVADTGGNRVRKIYWTGTTYTYKNLSMGRGSVPRSVSINTIDGTCWVANSGTDRTNGNRIRKLSAPGTSDITVVFTVTGFLTPYSVSVNPSDGSCWVADTGNNRIKKLAGTNGATLITITGFRTPQFVSVNPTDGSCWIADTGNNQAVKLDSEGNEEFRIGGFQSPLSISSSP